MSTMRFPMWWAGWWFYQYMEAAYKAGGWSRLWGVEFQITKQIAILSTLWIVWRAWRWISARWSIVKVTE